MSATGKKLRRPQDGKMVAGVCAGVGEYFGIDPTVVRIAWLVSLLAFGFGMLPYVMCWVVVPKG